jgi:hypothetical protein
MLPEISRQNCREILGKQYLIFITTELKKRDISYEKAGEKFDFTKQQVYDIIRGRKISIAVTVEINKMINEKLVDNKNKNKELTNLIKFRRKFFNK